MDLSSAQFLAAPSAGLVIVGASFGIAKLATAALEGMARQPEASAKIQTAMLIAAGMIEGVALFATYVCFKAVG